jgi:hypothetical protein
MIVIVFTTDTLESTTSLYMERAKKAYPQDTPELATSADQAELLLKKHGKDVRLMDCAGQPVSGSEILKFLNHIRKPSAEDAA